jgi:hypothetical protein
MEWDREECALCFAGWCFWRVIGMPWFSTNTNIVALKECNGVNVREEAPDWSACACGWVMPWSARCNTVDAPDRKGRAGEPVRPLCSIILPVVAAPLDSAGNSLIEDYSRESLNETVNLWRTSISFWSGGSLFIISGYIFLNFQLNLSVIFRSHDLVAVC